MPQTQPSRLPRLLSVQEAAEYLGISFRTLETWRQRGAGPPFIRLNARNIRYRAADLERWVEGQRRGSTSATSPPADGTDRLAAARRRLAR